MINLIRGEFYKIKRSKYFVGIMFLWALLGVSISYIIIKEANAHRTVSGINAVVFFLQFQILINFLYAAFAGVFVASDFEHNTINMTFTYGYSRSKVILSKIIVYIIYSLLMELVTVVIMGIIFSAVYGFNDFGEINLGLYLIRIIFIELLCSTATTLIIAAVSVISKSIIITLASPVVMFIPMLLNNEHIFAFLPYRAATIGIAPFAPKNTIIISVVSSLVTIFVITMVLRKYLSKLDIK